MACEICGRSNCSRCFHSVEEQQNFDEIIEPYKENLEREFNSGTKRLYC